MFFNLQEILDHSRSKQNSGKPSSSRNASRITLQQVRDCGSKLDVPLLSALCSDDSLLKQQGVKKPTRKAAAKSFQQHSTAVFNQSSSREPAHNDSLSRASADPHNQQQAQVSSMQLINKSNLPNCRYSLSGIYTTNQVPGPQITGKSNARQSNIIHQHPKPGKTKTQHQPSENLNQFSKISKESLDICST